MISAKTCVSEEGTFIFGIHSPCFKVENFREHDYISCLGAESDGTRVQNDINFPDKNINVKKADVIYEIRNPFPFRGTTYINSAWADKNADNPEKISLPARQKVHFTADVKQWLDKKGLDKKKCRRFP